MDSANVVVWLQARRLILLTKPIRFAASAGKAAVIAVHRHAAPWRRPARPRGRGMIQVAFISGADS
jgi:hypothetical protein